MSAALTSIMIESSHEKLFLFSLLLIKQKRVVTQRLKYYKQHKNSEIKDSAPKAKFVMGDEEERSDLNPSDEKPNLIDNNQV